MENLPQQGRSPSEYVLTSPHHRPPQLLTYYFINHMHVGLYGDRTLTYQAIRDPFLSN